MKKDIFNGNIKKEFIGYVQFTLIFVSVLWFIFFAFFLLFALLYDKIEPAARILMLVVSALSFLGAFLYPMVSLFAIKTYPKHPKLAKAMLKEFVFSTNESKIIDTIIKTDKLTASAFPISWDLTTNNILSYIPSEGIRKFLLKNKKNITIMQYATLAENYYKGNMVAIFEALRELSNNEYEKELFNHAVKDYRRDKYIGDRTQKFYEQNDPRAKKPLCVFEEFIKLPTLLNSYDVAFYLDCYNKKQLVVIGKVYKIEADENTHYDFSDLSYMAYDLNYDKLTSKEDIISIHLHVNYCEIEKIELSSLSQEQLKKYNLLKEFLEDIEL